MRTGNSDFIAVSAGTLWFKDNGRKVSSAQNDANRTRTEDTILVCFAKNWGNGARLFFFAVQEVLLRSLIGRIQSGIAGNDDVAIFKVL